MFIIDHYGPGVPIGEERFQARIHTRWISAGRCGPASWPRNWSAGEWMKPA
jgi:hypothetical protein